MMNVFHVLIICLVCSLSVNAVRADVLVHGRAANADTWIHSGVVHALQNRGWRDTGVVSSSPAGVRYFPALTVQSSGNTIYRVQLPATAPLILQASHLISELGFIQQRHPSESIIIAGHSAGGIVARLAAIRSDYVRIKSLITIAAPHLGTTCF